MVPDVKQLYDLLEHEINISKLIVKMTLLSDFQV